MKKPPAASPARLRVETTAGVLALLRRLVRTGLYGRSEGEAADRLICQRLQALYAGEEISDREIRAVTRRRRP